MVIAALRRAVAEQGLAVVAAEQVIETAGGSGACRHLW
jgi:hypothetical protein